jgi:hypothetical protein
MNLFMIAFSCIAHLTHLYASGGDASNGRYLQAPKLAALHALQNVEFETSCFSPELTIQPRACHYGWPFCLFF